MPKRLRLLDLRLSRLPEAVGLCVTDVVRIAAYVNSAQQRLLYCKEAGDEGWWGSWAEIAFNVSQATPYITLPREVARLQAVNICNQPQIIQNQFFEYLQFGNGRLPKSCCQGAGAAIAQVMTRNNVVTFTDLSSTPQILRLYPTSADDIGKRVLLQGTDNNGNIITSTEGTDQITGIYVTLAQPFVDCPLQFQYPITGIQKEITVGTVQLYQVDPTTGDEVLLLTMDGGEEIAGYRRFYLDSLPCGCCDSPLTSSTCPIVQVKAIAKLEPIPVRSDSDYLLLQNLEAIIEECQSIRYSIMDSIVAKQLSLERHKAAVRFLNGELGHYVGFDQPAVAFAPFGTARLENQSIGTLI